MANEYITRQAVRDTARAILKDPILIMAADAVAKAAPGVELVRCKDCMKYRDPFCMLNDTQSGYLTAVSPDHFCSCGERRDGE